MILEEIYLVKLLIAMLSLFAVSFSTSTVSAAEVDFVKDTQSTVLEFDAEAEQPTAEEIQDILMSAINAPSGRNLQPYWITVITDYDTQQELALTPEMTPQPGTVLFIYSYPGDQDPSGIDIGISYGFMHFMADALGYGTHIYSQPARMFAEDFDYESYGIPEGYVPLEFVLVGKADTVDAVSATTELPRAENFNIVE